MKHFFLIILLINSLIIYSQDKKTNYLESIWHINTYKIKKAEKSINHITDSTKINLLKSQLHFLKKGTYKYFKLPKKEIDSFNYTLQLLNTGDYYLFNYISKDSLALKYYSKALSISKNKKDSLLICESVKKLIYYTQKFNRDTDSFKDYINLHKNYAYNKNEKALSFLNELTFKVQNIGEKKKHNVINNIDFFKVIEMADKIPNDIIKANCYHLLGVKRASIDLEYKSALIYFDKAYQIYKKHNAYSFAKNRIYNYYISLGAIYYNLQNYKRSIKHLKSADSISKIKNKKRDASSLFYWFSKSYNGMGDYKNSYKYLRKRENLKDSINQVLTNIKILDFKIKYQTAEKEKENLQLKQDNLINEQQIKHSENLFYATLTFLILGGIIGFLSLKNSRKKRLLAEQQNQLEQQKNLTLLKEHEINTINAMIDGQEKERTRIAEDLHDNIGSVLATLKLHFENLQLNREKKHFNQDKLYKKTEKLIDEAYLKIRSIAHAKNSGVIANKGLLVAIKIMAEKISDANKINIDVIDFGLNKQLENSLEITVFRIIQELTTNIIKHSKATHASINISQFKNTLNIIVEDNGKGFDYKKVAINKGMGIGSIQTRIKHLNGTFEIDSTKNKGTSIIIDIPINFT